MYFGNHPGKLFGFSYRGRKPFEIDTGGTVDSYPTVRRRHGAGLVFANEAALESAPTRGSNTSRA